MLTSKNKPADIQTILEQSMALYQKTLSFSFFYSLVIAGLISFSPLLILSPYWPGWLPTLVFIFAGILAFILSHALLFHLYCYCNNVPSNLFFSLKQALLKFPALLLLMIIYTLIVLSGAALLIVPGIIFAFSLMFSFTLLLTGNQTIFQTLIASHHLVWGHWRHCFFTISTPLLLNAVISLVCFITVVEYSVTAKMSFLSTAFLLAVINIIVQSFFIPFIICVTLVLLHDLKQQKVLYSPPRN